MIEKDSVTTNLDEKLSKVKYKSGLVSHLVIDEEKCRDCKDKTCCTICPAKVYEYDKINDKINICYENCLECGACRFACPKNSIDWTYPQAGTGVTFKKG